jgi:hypothetical protein
MKVKNMNRRACEHIHKNKNCRCLRCKKEDEQEPPKPEKWMAEQFEFGLFDVEEQSRDM